VIDEIELHREELRALCRRFHVRRLDLFGSAARGGFDLEQNDIDFLVEFDRGHPDALSLKTYFGFLVGDGFPFAVCAISEHVYRLRAPKGQMRLECPRGARRLCTAIRLGS
jgi:hypothetical protein